METIVNLIGIACAINTVVLAYLTYLYFAKKDDTLQDDGTTNTDQEN